MWPILADSGLHFLPLLSQTKYYTLEETATNTPRPTPILEINANFLRSHVHSVWIILAGDKIIFVFIILER